MRSLDVVFILNWFIGVGNYEYAVRKPRSLAKSKAYSLECELMRSAKVASNFVQKASLYSERIHQRRAVKC